jgi:hypothetical protein
MRRELLCCLFVTVACVEPSEVEAGRETGACLDGECFDGLECLSNLCVGPDADPGDTESDPMTTTSPSSTSSSTSPTASSTATTNDTGDPQTSGDPETTGDPTDDTAPVDWGSCEQLDLLFVIDNSASMFDEQGALGAAAPDFLTELVARSGSSDHHVMVVDSDAWPFTGCETLCQFGGVCSAWEDYVCGETQPLQCEDVLGAGVTHPRGIDSSNSACGFDGDARWLSLDEPDAASRFVCAATVGTGSMSDPEVPMEAMVTAVNTVAGGAAAECNAGFLRDDAPLVVVFVTDEDDAEGDSSGTPQGWKQGLAAAKGGDADRIAVLGLFGDNDQPSAICEPLGDSAGAESSERLGEFVGLFDDRGLRSSVCADHYGDAFADLLDVLDSMCQ